MVAPHSPIPRAHIGRMLRERFVDDAQSVMGDIAAAVQERLTEILNTATTARESQMRRDAWMLFRDARLVWQQATVQAWRDTLAAAAQKSQPAAPVTFDISSLALVDAGAMDVQILASRLVQGLMEKMGHELDDLKIRLRLLEDVEELDAQDILLPEVLVQKIAEQWGSAGMPADAWPLVNDTVLRELQQRLPGVFRNANQLLIGQGILPVIELKDRVKAPVRKRLAPASAPAPVPHDPNGYTAQSYETAYGTAAAPPTAAAPMAAGESAQAPRRGGAFGGRLGWSAPAEETRMMTASTPLARAQQRAQGVAGQMRRIFADNVRNTGPGGDASTGAALGAGPSASLAQAIAHQVADASYVQTAYASPSPQGVAQVAGNLRERTAELKDKARTKSEKATIEIVALMFQAILAEERIPPGIRVWFARLQMPVLRTALEDADFFGATDHPARILIDRMGSCVMGFEGGGVQSEAMEKEVKRIVQVVEQYPETGKKVYQIVYAEFQKFLAKFLTEKSETQRVVSVAQQVEQKETLAIQYTIEMRNMLRDLPVRDEIREFLFKVWAEVMAVCALRKGPKHADTLSLKKCATDLVWSASAKPLREDRTRVIQDLPNLLLRLRSGMTLLGMLPEQQEVHIKTVSDTLADAFMSKTQAIDQEKIDAMAQRLGELEDFVSEDGMGDLPLDAQSIEMMLGIESSEIEVVANGGSKPSSAMLAWAKELEIGAWFTLDHNNQLTQVQYAWRSDGGQLNLFASAAGKAFLLQTGRLAAYLQAGLLLPQEEEALTVRATRDALAKLEANPERLLA